VTEELQVLYTFSEGDGTTVYDISGAESPLNLTIRDLDNVEWHEGALVVREATIISATESAARLVTAANDTQELTIEAWIEPAKIYQDGPARIVTMSENTEQRNFMLGQGPWRNHPSDEPYFYLARLRTTTTDANGLPSLKSPGESEQTAMLQHIVYTRSADGKARLYINGAEVQETTVDGTFDNWNTGYHLALANEFTNNRPWLGTYHLVAIYSQALSADEVGQNYQAGENAGD
jgi:hypothetical protein